ncbi:hypothetical protein DFR50_10369 [Roseiarcus fermentans]|uniref:Uncharacterized protein n=1 Tax=Roseiarcus fermentans TaxID=1473586 RepID=A0A366FR74_9HYPH|nr:hypothetical protein [Roseiarcus fermentans]RBP17184.1 hypothetical protein DFR50_10369 [Roseiarcus fermentans]
MAFQPNTGVEDDGRKRKQRSNSQTAPRGALSGRAPAHGAAVDDTAARERVAAAVARRSTDASEDLIAMRIARLDQAMQAARRAMRDGDLAALDRAAKIAREYDRYHGLALTLARGMATETGAAAPRDRRTAHARAARAR